MIFADHEGLLIAPGCQAPPLVCLQWRETGTRAELVHVRDPAFKRLWVEFLTYQTVAMHNAAFDMACLCAHDPELFLPLVFDAFQENRIVCTLMREVLILIAQGKLTKGVRVNLGASLERRAPYFTVDKTDPHRLLYGTLIDTPCADWQDGARKYALEDADAACILWTEQEAHAYALADQHRQAESAFDLFLMSCWGMRTDLSAVEMYHKTVLEGLDRDRATCRAAGLVRANGTKDTELAALSLVTAYEEAGLEVPRTPTGKVQLDAEACEKARSPLMEAYTRVTQATAQEGKVLRLRHGLIQPSFNPLVNTGRTSCRQGDDPKVGEAPKARGAQVQNLSSDICGLVEWRGQWIGELVDERTNLDTLRKSKAEFTEVTFDRGATVVQVPVRELVKMAGRPGSGIRECYTARPGHALNSVDMDTFELRTWAQVCINKLGWSDLAVVLNDPKRDPHVEMGARLEGITPEMAYALKVADPTAFKKLRGVAKGPNFGLPGGMGWARLIEYCWASYRVALGKTPEECEARARAAIRAWKECWSEADPYLKLIGRETANEGAYIIQIGSDRIRGDIGYCDAANGYFQALAADAIKAAGRQITRECYRVKSSPLYGCRPVNFVHDEYILEIPLDRLHEAAWRQAEIQREVVQGWLPHVLVTCRPTAMIHWTKAAEETTVGPDNKPCKPDAPGARLVPWLPEYYQAA